MDHVIYMGYIVNHSFFFLLFTVVWPLIESIKGSNYQPLSKIWRTARVSMAVVRRTTKNTDELKFAVILTAVALSFFPVNRRRSCWSRQWLKNRRRCGAYSCLLRSYSTKTLKRWNWKPEVIRVTHDHFREILDLSKQGSQWGTVCASWAHLNRSSPPSSLSCAWSWPFKSACCGCVYSLKQRYVL